MMRRAVSLLVLALLGGAAQAFVFVPQRTPLTPKAVLPGAALGQTVRADDTGRPYVLGGGTMLAFSDEGELRWRHEGCRDGFLEVTGKAVLVFDADKLLALAPLDGKELWSRPAQKDVAIVPRPADRERPDFGVVTVIEPGEGRVCVLELATGQVRGERKVGKLLGHSLLVEDSMLLLVEAPAEASHMAVVGVDLVKSGQAKDEALAWRWPVPEGEQVTSMRWLAGPALLAIATDKHTYLLD